MYDKGGFTMEFKTSFKLKLKRFLPSFVISLLLIFIMPLIQNYICKFLIIVVIIVNVIEIGHMLFFKKVCCHDDLIEVYTEEFFENYATIHSMDAKYIYNVIRIYKIKKMFSFIIIYGDFNMSMDVLNSNIYNSKFKKTNHKRIVIPRVIQNENALILLLKKKFVK